MAFFPGWSAVNLTRCACVRSAEKAVLLLGNVVWIQRKFCLGKLVLCVGKLCVCVWGGGGGGNSGKLDARKVQ